MKNHHQEHKYHQCEYSIKVLSMCSSRDQKITAAPHPPAQEIFTAESFTLGRMRAMNAVRVLCRPLQQVLSTAQNWVKLCPLLDQHSYS